MKFSINKFEYLCYCRDHEAAGRELLALLTRIDQNYGILMDVDDWAQSEEAFDIMDDHIVTRLASAITALVTDPAFTFSDEGFKHIALFQRWLAGIFAASAFRNGDHVLRSLGIDEDARYAVSPRVANMRKFQLFYMPESEVRLDWDALWDYDKVIAASLAMTIMSSRFLATPPAHQKRELILRWLPDRLAEIESIDALPMGVLHDMYMHCSYADLPGKHDIKKPINALIRRKLASLDLHDVERRAAPAAQGKPVVLVVLEWFSKNHSIYRTHSQTLVAMRERFHLVGMGFERLVDEAGRAVFDEFIVFGNENLWENARFVRETSEARGAQMMYMPSVGMFPITMVLACLRVAPIQLMALGHPATTHGHAMDYVVVEEDYVGDSACFSETLLMLPSDGMPYRAPAAMLELDLPPKKNQNGPVRIVVAATTIKLNPGFLQACVEIANQASVPVEFHFLVGQARGLTFPQVRNWIRRLMGDQAIVYTHQDYTRYMRVIAESDVFLNPFPFGNTNGIVDTVWAGLIGVCRTGREVHEHIDEGMFRRLGFPEWTIARTTQAYIDAALRLIGDADERRALSRMLAGPKAIERLIFAGRPQVLGERMHALWRERVSQEAAQSRPDA
ncbi:peptide transporter [Pararobbsia silviterrae]|uniref:Peptide transporter n=1 Tax=Pararobbsia silviterrae TaxID=1792498 RepID=A0A494XUL9_9BURK|nr:peptide transporter [Pararobbsia silviterrae]RKP53401.1 peptide transporter [Pararobbsia silviterrae]